MRRLIPFVALVLAMLLAAPGLSAQRDTFTIGRETGILLTFDPAVVYEVFGAALVDQLYDNLVVLELEDIPEPLPLTGPLKAGQFADGKAQLVVEVPALGFAWFPRHGPPGTPHPASVRCSAMAGDAAER